MEQEEIGARIAQEREKRNMSQSELARALGVTPQAVQKWESGGAPRFNRLKAVAAALSMAVQDLVKGTLYEQGLQFEADNDDERAQKKRVKPIQRTPADLIGKLPLISWVQAGDWSQIVDNFHAGDAEDWIPVPFNHGPNAFCLRVVGESMFDPAGAKSYAPGEFIAVDPRRQPENRSMVVVKLTDDDKATFKQLIIDPDGTRMLKALNPNWPRPFIEINGNATIVGVVIGKWVPE